MRLFEYQEVGAQWLANRKYALLADEMGLGKSAQAIRACSLIDAQRILILCPAIARMNWQAEWEKFSRLNLPVFVIMGARQISKLGSAPGVTICSYDLATKKEILSSLVASPSWHVCILDEAHYLKSRAAKRTRAVLGIIAPKADRLWFLTGTPAPNNAAELWPILRTMGLPVGPYQEFLARFCLTRETPYGTQIIGGKNIPELRKIIEPVILRRRKDQVMTELPKIMFSDVLVEASPVPIDVWEHHFREYVLRPDLFKADMEKQVQILSTLTEDLGIGPKGGSLKILEGIAPKVKSLRRWVGLQKVQSVIKLVSQELKDGAYDKIVLFAVHKDVLSELLRGLADFGSVLIYGGTPPEKRDRAIKKFQTDPKTRVFIGQIIAAGTAINLTAAHHVMVVEADWTPANNQQAVMRCHRIGQTKPVTVRFAAIAGSIDQRIQNVLRRKTRTLVEIFDFPVA